MYFEIVGPISEVETIAIGRSIRPRRMAPRPEGEEAKSMRCEVCGAELAAVTTDLPFKVREPGIVILKAVPVLQCVRCPQYLLEDGVNRSSSFSVQRRPRRRR